MRSVIRTIQSIFYKPVLTQYLEKERRFRWQELDLLVPPGVFHPGFFSSSMILAEYLQTLPLSGLQVLDLGTGSGFLALVMALQEAMVDAVDLNPQAVKTALANATRNRLLVRVQRSDVFDGLSQERYDLIAVNPPFYPGPAKNEAALAWYCGAELEYFQKLFGQLSVHLKPDGCMLMVMTAEGPLQQIHHLAAQAGFRIRLLLRKRRWAEDFIIFGIYKNRQP